MTLTKVASRVDESRQWFEKAERFFNVINNEISFKEGCNLLFNMLLHYNFMLNDFNTTIELEKRADLLEKLQRQIEVSPSQALMKRSLVAIQRVFVEPNQAALITHFKQLLA